jgi:hypothetical protein
LLGVGPRITIRWALKSSPRLAARDGMKQEPYEFRSLATGIKW